jgi:predicted metal-dependent enzyme (double-stranded beta helix superfamily)
MHDPFAAFIDDIESMRRSVPSDAELISGIAARLAQLNRETDWLPSTARQASEDSYLQHVLHVAPDGGFSVASLVWKPEQWTPIHNHVAWCVVGVYQGIEKEIRYQVKREGAETYLAEKEVRTASAGFAEGLLPDGKDIHAVGNAGDGIAISIHVYGADLRKLGTSIDRRFDMLPLGVRAHAQATTTTRR